jgi:hypothetical protein
MHESLGVEQLPASANLNSTQPAHAGRHSAKVLLVAMAWLWLAWLSLPTLSAAISATQEKQPEATAQAESADEAAPTALQVIDLSDQVVRDVLTNLQRGIETHSLERVLEVFDQQNMKDYAQFHEQMVAFFRRYDSVRFRYQLLQVSSDVDHGFAVADIDMDGDPSDILPTPQRRSAQIRFQMKRSPKGWKVIGLQPADFFNQ